MGADWEPDDVQEKVEKDGSGRKPEYVFEHAGYRTVNISRVSGWKGKRYEGQGSSMQPGQEAPLCRSTGLRET